MAVKVKSIWLNRAEGPSKECFARTVKGFEEAGAMLRDWARSAPKGGAYDKVDFKVTWADGETYEGRYDMHHGDEGDLAEHIRSFLMFHGGEWCPPHMEQGKYEELIAMYERQPGAPKRADYLKFMRQYLP